MHPISVNDRLPEIIDIDEIEQVRKSRLVLVKCKYEGWKIARCVIYNFKGSEGKVIWECMEFKNQLSNITEWFDCLPDQINQN